MNHTKRLLIFVSGLSGAGKTTALSIFKDMQCHCVDNLPISLIDQFLAHIPHDSHPIVISVGIDTIDFDTHNFLEKINLFKQNYDVRLLFLKANHANIHKRYSLTGMRHPLCQDGILSKAIDTEYNLYTPLIESATLLLETNDIGPKELKRRLLHAYDLLHANAKPVIILTSFGFKHGVPVDVETIFDARILQNPHWEKDLAALTGKDQAVISFLKADTKSTLFLNHIMDYIEKAILPFLKGDKAFYHIAFGCTGGRHRSVYCAEEIANKLKKTNVNCQVNHSNIQ